MEHMEFDGDTLVINRTPSALDELVLDFVAILDDMDITYTIVSGYVAILAGRTRATEDIDIVIDRLSSERTMAFADRLRKEGYWGASMPLDELQETLSDGLRQRVAEEGQMIPNFELWFVKNEYEQAALASPLTARIGPAEINLSPLELQVAYKLFLGSEKDFEDALHLYDVFEGHLDEDRLQRYVTELEVTEAYAELREA
jgi:hypothetical protein